MKLEGAGASGPVSRSTGALRLAKSSACSRASLARASMASKPARVRTPAARRRSLSRSMGSWARHAASSSTLWSARKSFGLQASPPA